jgi:hypothetical protein
VKGFAVSDIRYQGQQLRVVVPTGGFQVDRSREAFNWGTCFCCLYLNKLNMLMGLASTAEVTA